MKAFNLPCCVFCPSLMAENLRNAPIVFFWFGSCRFVLEFLKVSGARCSIASCGFHCWVKQRLQLILNRAQLSSRVLCSILWLIFKDVLTVALHVVHISLRGGKYLSASMCVCVCFFPTRCSAISKCGDKHYNLLICLKGLMCAGLGGNKKGREVVAQLKKGTTERWLAHCVLLSINSA